MTRAPTLEFHDSALRTDTDPVRLTDDVRHDIDERLMSRNDAHSVLADLDAASRRNVVWSCTADGSGALSIWSLAALALRRR